MSGSIAPRPWTIRRLGEVVLRVDPELWDETVAFWRDVVGLEVFEAFETHLFFKIDDGSAGHISVLALFRADVPSNAPDHAFLGRDPARSSMHHLALEVTLDDWRAAHETFAAEGRPLALRTFPWVGWRSLFLSDPSGHVVEFVAYDPAVRDAAAD